MNAADRVARARVGDRAAWEEIAAEHEEPLKRYLLTMVGDESAARDLVQDVFQRALAGLSGLRDETRLKSWLLSIAVNRCRTWLRREWNRPRSAEPDELAAAADPARQSVLSSVVRRESAEALALAIDRLPVLLREAFVLHHVERLPYEEIAEVAGASVSALHVRAHRARALLRRQLGSVVDTFWLEA